MRRFIVQSIWVGFSKFLLVFYFAVAVWLVWDFKHFWNLGLRIGSARQLSAQYRITDWHILSIFLLAFSLPVLMTGVKYLLHNRINGRIYDTGRRTKFFVLTCHVLFFAALAYVYWLSPYMELLSGYKVVHREASFAYQSTFLPVVHRLLLPLNAFIVISYALQILVRIRVSKRNPDEVLTDFKLWLRLADPEGLLYPVHRGHLNFNSGAVSPEIRFVREYSRRIERRYHSNVAGSRDAARYLRQIAEECRTRLSSILTLNTSPHNYSIEFFSGTSRAIEIALCKDNLPSTIILSPYEHPSELAVASWIASKHNVDVKHLQIPPQLHDKEWGLQEDTFWKKLGSATADSGKDYVLMLSEVAYATGMLLPVKRILDRIRTELNGQIRCVIDGSHAVGNAKSAFSDGILPLSARDCYVFGSHKWLLAPEPCGVLVSLRQADANDKASYDAWGVDLPVSTVGVARIAGLRGSLELLTTDDRLESFVDRASMMRDEFIRKAEPHFVVVGPTSNRTNMISIKPRDGYEWREDIPERHAARLARAGINCEIIDIGDDVPWVRLTFLYFVRPSDVQHLVKKLRRTIRNAV